MDSSEFSLHAEVEDYHWWFSARREILFELLRRQVPPHTGRLVVEIGCGTGGNLKYLKDYYRVMGVDRSRTAVEYARQRVDCPILIGDFTEQLASYWPEIDVILLADVLEHIEDDRTFLQRIVTAMKPGAILLVTVPAHPFLWSSHDLVLQHLRRYTAARFKRLWEGLPVNEVFFSPFNAFLFPPIALYRLLESGKDNSKSHLSPTTPAVNRLLRALFSAESLWLNRMPLPFGCSYCALLKKPGDG